MLRKQFENKKSSTRANTDNYSNLSDRKKKSKKKSSTNNTFDSSNKYYPSYNNSYVDIEKSKQTNQRKKNNILDESNKSIEKDLYQEKTPNKKYLSFTNAISNHKDYDNRYNDSNYINRAVCKNYNISLLKYCFISIKAILFFIRKLYFN